MSKSTCKDYKGILRRNEPCGAGVTMKEITGGGPGWLKKIPCVGTNTDPVKCDKMELPTQAEIDQKAAEWKVTMDRLMNTMPLLEQIKRDNPDGGAGAIDCPNCNGQISWAMSPDNGHVRGQCSTADCLKFME
jgi:hypothetical protein